MHEKVFLEISQNFTGKHLCQSLIFNEFGHLRSATLLKKRLWHRCFPVNFTKFLRTPFLTEHLLWLLLEFTTSKTEIKRKRTKWIILILFLVTGITH